MMPSQYQLDAVFPLFSLSSIIFGSFTPLFSFNQQDTTLISHGQDVPHRMEATLGKKVSIFGEKSCT
jgi:hypothetical protein